MKLLGNMLDLDDKLCKAAGSSVVGHSQMDLVRFETQYHTVFTDGTALGEMNTPLGEALNSVFEQQYSLEFEVFVPTRAVRETISKAEREKDAVARVQINVYGAPAASRAVGKELSDRKIYLQRPDHVRNGATYDNPHFLKLPNNQATETVTVSDIVEPAPEKVTGQTVKEAVKNVYSALTRGQGLVALESDRRLRTQLLS